MNIHNVYKTITNKNFLKKLANDDILEMAASLSFYTALSLAPLLILLLTLIAFIDASVRDSLLSQAHSWLGEKGSQLVRDIAINVSQNPTTRDRAGAIGLLTLMASAGAIFEHLRHSLNRIFEAKNKDSGTEKNSPVRMVIKAIRSKLFNIGMVLLFVLFSMGSLIVSSFFTMYLEGTIAVIGQVANFLISLLVFSVLFSGLYYFLPQTKISKVVAFKSGLLTAILFTIGKSLIAIYLGKSAASSMYGAAGSLLALLVWVYYSSAIIFISAEIAHELNREDGERTSPPEVRA